MKDLEKFVALLVEFRIEHKKEEFEDGYTVTIEEGKGYGGFFAKFDFDESGKFQHYGLWE